MTDQARQALVERADDFREWLLLYAQHLEGKRGCLEPPDVIARRLRSVEQWIEAALAEPAPSCLCRGDAVISKGVVCHEDGTYDLHVRGWITEQDAAPTQESK